MKQAFTLLFLLLTLLLIEEKILAKNTKTFVGEKVTISSKSRGLLSNQFKDYDVYQITSTDLNKFVKNESYQDQVLLKLGKEYEWDLTLYENDIRANHCVLTINTEAGIIQREPGPNTTFAGYINNGWGGEVRLTIDKDFIFGTVPYEGAIYYIEPMRLQVPNAPQDYFLVYNTLDVIPGENNKCGLIETEKIQQQAEEQSQQATQKTVDGSSCKEVEVAIAADFSMYTQHNSSTTDVMNYINGVYNTVQLDYNQFLLIYNIVEYFIHTTSATTNPWTQSNNTTDPSISASLLLSEFRDWGNAGNFTNTYDLAQIWTEKDIDNGERPFTNPNYSTGVVGLASLDAVCSNRRYSLIEDFAPNSSAVTRVVVSHELGHNWGCPHNYSFNDACDPPNRPGGLRLIMDPSANGNAVCWSDGAGTCEGNSVSIIEARRGSLGCLSAIVSAGTAFDIEACVNETNPIDLNTFLLNADVGGSWSVSGTAPAGGTFDGTTGMFTPNGNTVGMYMFDYVVDGPNVSASNCPDIVPPVATACQDMTTIQVTLVDLMTGTPEPAPQICSNSTTAVDLRDLLTNEAAGGTWTETTTSTGGAFSTTGDQASFTPDGQATGTYTFEYTQTGTSSPAVAAQTCNYSDGGTGNSGQAFDNSGAIACMPDSRVQDFITYSVVVEVTNFTGTPSDLTINIRNDCFDGSPSVIIEGLNGIGTYTYTQDAFPDGFDPRVGICTVLFDGSTSSTITYTVDVTINYPAIPETGLCASQSSMVNVEVIDCASTCEPPTTVACSAPAATTLTTTWTEPGTAPGGYAVQYSADGGTTWTTGVTTATQHPWINEIHYDNAGTDADEGFEIAGPAGLDLTCYQVALYTENGTVYRTEDLTGMVDDEGAGYGAIWFPVPLNQLQNGPSDGLALVYDPSRCNCSGEVSIVQFLSYEGALTATDGPASGMTSTDIGVTEGSGTAVGDALQVTGCGTADPANFTWQAPAPHSRGSLNSGQAVYTVAAGTATFTAERLLPCTTYNTRVISVCCDGTASAAVDDGGTSCMTTDPTAGALALATGSMATVCEGSGSVTVEVSGESEYCSQYQYVLTDDSDDIQTGPQTSATFDLSGLADGTYYIYGVIYNTAADIDAGATNISGLDNGCLDVVDAGDRVEITVAEIESIDAVVPMSPTTCGGSDGELVLTFSPTGTATENYTVTYTLDGSGTPTTVTGIASTDDGSDGSFETITVSGLGIGAYTNITIQNETTMCTSTAFAGPVTLVDPTAESIDAVVPMNPTTCGGSDGELVLTFSPTGTATENYTVTYTLDGSGTPTTVTGIASTDDGSDGSFETITVSGLGIGAYTNITIQNETTMCTSTAFAGPVTLVDPTAESIDAVVPMNPTTCGGNDGELVLTFSPTGTATENYTVTYTLDGSGTPTTVTGIASTDDGSDGSFETITVSGLGIGAYTNITIQNETTMCTSTAFAGPVTLVDPTAESIDAVVPMNPTTCGGNDGELVLTFSPTGTATENYTVTYTLDGSGTPTTVTGIASTDDGSDGSFETSTVTGLGAGAYTNITIQNETTMCTSTAFAGPVNIADPVAAESIDAVVPMSPTACGGNDGELVLTFSPTGTATENYTVTYTLDGSGTPTTVTGIASTDDGSDGSFETITVPGLGIGAYTNITIQNETTMCTSTAFAGPVNIVDPSGESIDAVVPMSPTTCGGSDGELVLTFSPTGTATENYTVTYTLDGSGTPTTVTGIASTDDGSDGSFETITVSGLGIGAYTNITIQNETTMCTSTAFAGPVNITDLGGESIDAVVPMSPTTCGGNDGELVLTFSPTGTATENYTVTYTLDGSGTPTTVTGIASTDDGSDGSFETITVSGLGIGAYTNITIQNETTMCTSTAFAGPVNITDLGGETITVSGNNLTTCQGANGELVISFTPTAGATENYIVTYTLDGAGTPTTTAAIASTESTGGSGTFDQVVVTGLAAGSYTNISIENQTTMCTSNVDAGPVVLTEPGATIAENSTTPTTTCGGTNGEIELSGLVASTMYDINYTDDAGNPQSTTGTSDAGGLLSITGLAAGTYTNISVTQTGTSCMSNTIASITVTGPGATISVANTTDPATCGGTDGTIVIDGLTPSTNYDVTYDDSNGAQTFTGMSDAAGELTITGLGADTYTNIIATEDGTACPSNAVGPETLADPTAPVITLGTLTDPMTCVSTDGSIQIQGLDPSTTYDFSYDLMGNTVTGSAMTDGSGDLLIDNLDDGMYTNIFVTDQTTMCPSNTVGPATLNDPAGVTISIGGSTDPTTCGGIEGTITITGVDDNTLYDVDFTDNGNPVTTVQITSEATGNTLIITGLDAGTYANITLTDATSSCSSMATGSVTLSDPAGENITIGGFSDPTTCNGTDGSITLNGLTNGVTYNVDYLFNGAVQSDVLTASGGSVVIPNLGAGVYTNIQATNQTDNCASNTITTMITLSDPTATVISIGASANPTTCGGADGSITITGVDNNTSYDISLTIDGNSLTIPFIASDATGNSLTIMGLDAAIYDNITVTESGCTSNAVGPITLSDPTPPSISIAGTVAPDCGTVGSGPTPGSITLSGLMSGLTYTINYSSGAGAQTETLTANAAGEVVIGNLGSDTYSNITATINNCTSNAVGPITFTTPVCCFAESGQVTVEPVCPEEDIVVTTNGTHQTAGGYALIYILTDNSGQILEVNNTGIFSAYTEGTYTSYSLSEDTADPANPAPTVGSNISSLNGATGCFELSDPQTVNMPGPLAVAAEGAPGQGTNGGVGPFYYNTYIIEVTGGTKPYQFDWMRSGYVRYRIRYTATGAIITIIYADNANWGLTITDRNDCETMEWVFGEEEHLNISSHSVTPANFGATGAVDIDVTGGDSSCPQGYTYQWFGPRGFTATTEDISNVRSGWYQVIVTDCAGDITNGWYWVPRKVIIRPGFGFIRGKVSQDLSTPLLGAYPNPLTTQATIQFAIAETAETNISLYSLDGKQVLTVFDGEVEGTSLYEIPVDATDLASGIYLVRLVTAAGETQQHKLVITK